MKKLFILCLLITFISSISFAQSTKYDNDEHVKLSKQFMQYLNSGEFDKANAMCETAVAKQLDKKMMGMITSSLSFQVGEFLSFKESRKMEQMGKRIVVLICDYERAVCTYNFSFDQESKIIGFVITGKDDKAIFKLPPYADSTKYSEREFKFGKKGWELPAILTIPKNVKNPPVLILVHGSGPNDKDETIGPNKPFKDLASGLASKGIAVFRYDKRTKAHGLRYVAEKTAITLDEETTDDAVLAVDTLSRLPDNPFKKIFVLGHSQGGYAMPRIIKNSDKLTGAIIMSGSNLALEDVVLYQYNYIFSIDGKIEKEEQDILDSLKQQVELVKSDTLNINLTKDKMPLGIPVEFWLDARKYKPLEMIEETKKPVLVLQGERDYQVTVENFNNWNNALKNNKEADKKLYPKLNHLFLEGDSKSTPSEYMIPSHIPEYVVDDIKNWILKK